MKWPGRCPHVWMLSPTYQSLVTDTRAMRTCQGLAVLNTGREGLGGPAGARTPHSQPQEWGRNVQGRVFWAGQQAYLRELPVSKPLHPPHARDCLALGRGSVGHDDRRPPGKTFDLSPDELPNSKFLPILKTQHNGSAKGTNSPFHLGSHSGEPRSTGDSPDVPQCVSPVWNLCAVIYKNCSPSLKHRAKPFPSSSTGCQP